MTAMASAKGRPLTCEHACIHQDHVRSIGPYFSFLGYCQQQDPEAEQPAHRQITSPSSGTLQGAEVSLPYVASAIRKLSWISQPLRHPRRGVLTRTHLITTHLPLVMPARHGSQALPRVADFSSNWITSGLPTTRTSALTLYAS